VRGKGSRCVSLTHLPPTCFDCVEIWEPQTPGTLRACPDCTGIALTLPLPLPLPKCTVGFGAQINFKMGVGQFKHIMSLNVLQKVHVVLKF
jgi:hypothetical protein